MYIEIITILNEHNKQSSLIVTLSSVVADLELGERSGSGDAAPSGFWGRSPPEAESFLFLYIPREGPFFTSPQNFINFVNHTYFK